jgi:hypothetical protein
MLTGHTLMSQIGAAEEEESDYKGQQRDGGYDKESPHKFSPDRDLV